MTSDSTATTILCAQHLTYTGASWYEAIGTCGCITATCHTEPDGYHAHIYRLGDFAWARVHITEHRHAWTDDRDSNPKARAVTIESDTLHQATARTLAEAWASVDELRELPIPTVTCMRPDTVTSPQGVPVALGAIASFPSYGGKTHCGEITELFQTDGEWWVMVTGPYAPDSPQITDHYRRPCKLADLTILDITPPQPDQIWTTTHKGRTHRLLIRTADGLTASCRNLDTGRVNTYQLFEFGWHPEPTA